MKIETVCLAGQHVRPWGICVDGLLDCDLTGFSYEKAAVFAALLRYPGSTVITTASPEHYSNLGREVMVDTVDRIEQRIAAALAFCEGTSTEDLEELVSKHLTNLEEIRRTRDRLRAERNLLLDAVQHLSMLFYETGPENDNEHDSIEEARGAVQSALTERRELALKLLAENREVRR